MSRVIGILVVAVALASLATSVLSLGHDTTAIVLRPRTSVGCELSIDDTPDTDIGGDGMYVWSYHDIIPRDALDQYHRALVRWNEHNSPEHFLVKNIGKLRVKIGNCITSALKSCVEEQSEKCYSTVSVCFKAGKEFTASVVDALEREIENNGYDVVRSPAFGCYGEVLKITVYNNHA